MKFQEIVLLSHGIPLDPNYYSSNKYSWKRNLLNLLKDINYGMNDMNTYLQDSPLGRLFQHFFVSTEGFDENIDEYWRNTLIELQVKRTIYVLNLFVFKPERFRRIHGDKYITLLEYFPRLICLLGLEKDDIFIPSDRLFISKCRGLLSQRPKKWINHINFASRQIFSHDYKLPYFVDWLNKIKKRINILEFVSVENQNMVINTETVQRMKIVFRQTRWTVVIFQERLYEILESQGLIGRFDRKYWWSFARKFEIFLTYIEKLKQEEFTLTDKSISYEEKIPTLVTVWLNLKELIKSTQTRAVDRIIEWAQRHTLNIVLHGDWSCQSTDLKESLYTVVYEFDQALSETTTTLVSKRCKKLIEVIKDPWGDKTLFKILNEPENCDEEAELQFFSSENGYIVAMRLKKLCDSRCEDLALRFAKACMRCLRMKEKHNFHLLTTQDQKRYILDIYIALLHKYKQTQEIISELKRLTLQEGLQLVLRFTNKRVELSRIWKHCSVIAELAAKFFTTAAMMKPIEEASLVLPELLKAWLILNDKLEGIVVLPNMMRKMIQAVDSSAHIYMCCEILNKQYGNAVKPFMIELYIRALTTDLNELEKQKQMSNDEKVDETAKRLADGFLSLANILKDNLYVSRECVLTSFSLNPTWNCMEYIEKQAMDSGKIEENVCDGTLDLSIHGRERQRENMTIDNSNQTRLLCTGDKYSNLNIPTLDTGQSSSNKNIKSHFLFSDSELSQVLDAEALGLSEQLCDDLAVVLSSPRYQYLSWVLDWPDLKAACRGYLSSYKGSRHMIKELKYLNIDYNQFKDWPIGTNCVQYGGIEKGYEQYTEDEDDEETSTAESDIMDIYSDCSMKTNTTVSRRHKKQMIKIYSSDDEFDNDRNTASQSSDLDTNSQDADSLEGDGLLLPMNKPSSNENRPKFTMIVKGCNDMNIPRQGDNIISLFAQMGKTETKKLFTPPIIPFVFPEKRSSDPKTLQSLRMYRTEKNKKKNIDDDVIPPKIMKKTEPSTCVKTSDGKVIKLLQPPNMNPCVLLDRKDCNSFQKCVKKNIINKDYICSENKQHKYTPTLTEIDMNPRVVLDRCEDLCNAYKKKSLQKPNHFFHEKEKKRRKLDLFADVPGLNTLEMIRPSVVHPTVQVVQITNNLANTQQIRPVKSQGNSASVTATTSNLVTSTPVTAHIQRVGQPPVQEKSAQDNESEIISNSSQSSSDIRLTTVSSDSSVIQTDTVNQASVTKPSNSQTTPTLVNILSQQIIRPGQSTTPTNRNSALINILSQQIIKPPTAQLPQKVYNVVTSAMDSSLVTVTDAISSHTQAVTTTTMSASNISPIQVQNSIKLVTSSTSQQIPIQQIFNAQQKNNNQVLKNINLVTNTGNPVPVDTARLVQFLCKSDGKVVHLTPYSTNANIKLQTIDPSKLIKTTSGSVLNKQPATQSVPRASTSSQTGYAENFNKFLQTSGVARTGSAKNTQTEFTPTEEVSNSSLPKFQQAFGKAGYQSTNTIDAALSSVETITTTNSTLTTTSVQTVTSDSNKGTTTCVQINQSASLNPKNLTTTTVTAKPVLTNKNTISPIGVQTIQGSVIYARQVPVSLSVSSDQINLIPNATVTQAEIGRGQVLRITSATGEQLNTSKDNVIMRNKMSALLAAALQSNVSNRSSAVVSTITSTTTSTIASNIGTVVSSTYSQANRKNNSESDVCDVDSSSNDSQTNTVTNTTPTLVAPMRIALPMMQRTPGPNGMQTTRIVRPILQIPQSMIRGSGAIRQQVLLATAPVAMTGVVTCTPQNNPVPIEENLISHSNIEPSVSSTTLEQLREFDLVLEQVKERSTVQPNTVQNKIQVVKQQPPISVATDLQEVISNVSVSYMNPSQMSQKVSTCSTVVVVTTYCNVQPAASPALSVTSQSSSSPCVTPAPTSSGSVGKTVPKTSAKSPKSKTVKTTAHASKTSPIPKPQQKPQEDEQTTQRIFDILAEYAEQLRNSPDLNNKPAPRRRSNPPTNPSSSSKRKKCSSSKKPSSSGQCNSLVSELSPGTEDPRTMGSEDSCGIVQLSVQNSPQESTITDDHQSPQCSTDFSSVRSQQSETSDSNNVESQLSQTGRQFIITDSHNQPRNVIIAESAVKEAIVSKLSNTAAVIVPANYIVPVVKGGHSQIAVVSGSSKILATVPTNSGSNMLLFQGFVNQNRKPINAQQNIKTVKYSTVQPLQGISTQILSGVNVQSSVVLSPSTETVTLTHPLAFKKVSENTANSDDKSSLSNETIIANTSLPISSASQKCNVILSSGNQTDLNQINVTTETNSSAINQQDNVENTDEKTKSEHCVKIMPMCSEAISVDNEGLKIIDSSSTNATILQNSTFSINFSTKESTTVPVPVFSFKRSPISEKDKNTYQIAYLQTKVGEVAEVRTNENKVQQNVIRTIIDNSTSEKTVSSSNSNVKFPQMDCTSTVDHYSKMYIEEKKKTNTNGPMLGQSDSDSHIVMRRESDKVDKKRKLTRSISDGATITTFAYHKQKKIQHITKTEKDLNQRKQEAVERELCLQKSLSEECEDLGVDEPSTSDLFPEADLLFDSNNSPSFDQLSQDIDKKYVSHNFPIEGNEDVNKKQEEISKKKNDYIDTHEMSQKICEKKDRNVIVSEKNSDHIKSLETRRHNEGNEDFEKNEKKTTVTLFSDDDNSDSTLRTDLLFESLDYGSGVVEIDYTQREKQLSNGSKDGIIVQSSTSNFSGSSYEDHHLMTNCASVSDASSPTQYDVNSSPLMHKYKYKYCNRKRLLSNQNLVLKQDVKPSDDWEENTQVSNVMDVIKMSSSDEEDTSESVTERVKSSASRSPSPCERGKRSASPSWEENNDESSHSYRNMYSSNKVLKLAMNSVDDSVCSADESSDKHRKSDQCTLECLDSCSLPSPLSPEDGEIGAFNTGRTARRSTQRLKKKCPCCTSPDKPKKLSNLKKLTSKGQFTKKR